MAHFPLPRRRKKRTVGKGSDLERVVRSQSLHNAADALVSATSRGLFLPFVFIAVCSSTGSHRTRYHGGPLHTHPFKSRPSTLAQETARKLEHGRFEQPGAGAPRLTALLARTHVLVTHVVK